MGEFGATLLIARPEYPTMPIVIYRLLGQPGALNYGQALAMSTLLMLVCAVGVPPDRAVPRRARWGSSDAAMPAQLQISREVRCSWKYRTSPNPTRACRCCRTSASPSTTGEIVCLLGPSGCGKTTLLRIIAGLEAPDTGQVIFDGQDLADVPVHRRNFGFMFQDYALFPHKDVAAERGLRAAHAGPGPRPRSRRACARCWRWWS